MDYDGEARGRSFGSAAEVVGFAVEAGWLRVGDLVEGRGGEEEQESIILGGEGEVC